MIALKAGRRVAPPASIALALRQPAAGRGDEFSRQIEGNGDLLYALLPRRLDQLCWMARLGQQQPDSRHRRSAGAEVKVREADGDSRLISVTASLAARKISSKLVGLVSLT